MNFQSKKIIRYLIPLSIFLTFGSIRISGQNTRQKPLDSVLQILEKRFDVAFTFADDNILDKHATIPAEGLNLLECLQSIEKQTGLQFRILDTRYIAITESTHDFEVRGRIVDKSTKQQIGEAVVFSGNSYSVSNKDGFFAFKGNSLTDSILTIRHTGYKTITFSALNCDKDSAIYELVPNVRIIEEIVVNYIARGINKLADGSIQLNIQNLETLPGLSEPDVLHTVQILPGIESVSESVSDINIRGGTNDQNLVLWDGVKIYQTGHFFGLISAFNSRLINKTIIAKNGTSAKYGEGVSGVIDMRQQNFRPKNFELSGGINLISADIISKIPLGRKLSLILGARRSVNDLIITPPYKSYYNRAFQNTNISEYINSIDNHNFSFYDLSSRLYYDISDHDKIRLSLLNIENDISYKENTFTKDTLQGKKSSLNQNSFLSGFNYSHYWDKSDRTSVFAYISRYNLNGINVDAQNSQIHIQENNVTDWGFKLSSRNYFNRSDYILNGYQFNEIGVQNLDNITNPGYHRNIKEVLRIHSLFSEVTFFSLLNRLYLRLGLRANYLIKFSKFLYEPRVSLNIRLNDFITCEMLAEIKNQYTTQVIDYQTDFLGVEKRRWILADHNKVPIINSNQFSVGTRFSKNNLLASVEIYNKHVSGIITPSQGFQNQFEYVFARGEYNTQGLEVLINKRSKKTNAWINYTFSENDYSFSELIPPDFPNNLDIRHTLSLGGSLSLKDFEISGGFNYRTGKPATKPTPDNNSFDYEINYETPNSSRMTDFSRVDLSAKYNFNIQKKKRGVIGISVWNVLGNKNIINTFYRRNRNNEIEKVIQYSLGITPNVSLRVSL